MGDNTKRDDLTEGKLASCDESSLLPDEIHRSTNRRTASYERTNENSRSPWFKLVTVEPVILLFSFAYTLTSPVSTTLYLTHTCRSLGFNQSYCSELEEAGPKRLESLVQPETNMLKMYEMLIETGLPAFMTMFIGPWSDLYGRKTFLVAPIIGCALKYLILLAMSFYPALPPQYLLLAGIPVSLTGGTISVIAMCYCYMADVTEERNRGFRMGVIEASFFTGLLLGTTTSTVIFVKGRYLATFAMSSAVTFCAAVYATFWVKESIQNIQEGSAAGDFLNVAHVRDMITACCRRGGPRQRTIIALVTVALATSILTMSGEGSVQFLFVRNKFAWDIGKYMTYSSVNLVLQIVCTMAVVSAISSWLPMSDALASCLSFLLKVAAAILAAVSPSDWWMYLAAAVGMFGSVCGPLSRSIISKTVDPQDIGKVFSMVSLTEAITPLAAGPLYAMIYNDTMISFPGAFFLLSAVIFAIDFILLGVVVILQRHQTRGYGSIQAQ